MADRTNCDVCGRIVNLNNDHGGLFNQHGGYACGRCVKWAEENNITCPICHRPVIYADYPDLCTCDCVTVTRQATRERK